MRISRHGKLTLSKPADEVFPLFTPLGEKDWVDDWDPCFHWPASGELSEDLVFTTRAGGVETLWCVGRLDDDRREVEYIRFTPGLHVAKVLVRCDAVDSNETTITVGYTYVSLSDEGERLLADLTEDRFADMIAGWQRTLLGHLQAK